MGAGSKIEWCHATFNPWVGCTKVSDACTNCYAEALSKRWGWAKWGPGEKRVRTSEANWRKPLAWNRKAAKEGRRYRVFCASLSDVFDAEVSDDWRDDLFTQVILPCEWLDFLLLTKRPQVALKYTSRPGRALPPNVWLGTTVEDQKMADLRVPILLSIRATVHFLSCEPLLGPLDITPWLNRMGESQDFPGSPSWTRGILPSVDWIIAGGESGPSARDTPPDWFRQLRDECHDTAAFFMKQMTRKAPIPEDLLIREFPR